jgi:sec-independent protein translocase protein TatA
MCIFVPPIIRNPHIMLLILLFLESIGTGELLVILFFVLIFFGSKKIPDLARGLGKGMREMKDAMQGIQQDIREGVNLEEEKKILDDVHKEISDKKNES